jgi:hypothetical protein
MKNFVAFGKLVFQLGVIAWIVFTLNLGCAPTPLSTALLSPKNAALPHSIEPTQPPQSLAPEDLIWELIEQVEINRALTDLQRLTGEAPICLDNECYTIINRLTGSEGLQWAKDYVYQELINLGYSVEIRDWSVSGYADQNLIARKPGTVLPGEEIYLVAHLDGRNLDGVVRAPAADDNASGVVSILELARVLSSRSLDRTLVLLISTGEEFGCLGVRSYLDQLSAEELAAIQYVVNIDMIGYDANRDGAMELWSGDHPPSLILAQMLQEIIPEYQLELSPSIVTGCD